MTLERRIARLEGRGAAEPELIVWWPHGANDDDVVAYREFSKQQQIQRLPGESLDALGQRALDTWPGHEFTVVLAVTEDAQ